MWCSPYKLFTCYCFLHNNPIIQLSKLTHREDKDTPSFNNEHVVETGLEPRQFDFRGHTFSAYVVCVVDGVIIIFIAVFLLFPSPVGWRVSKGA